MNLFLNSLPWESIIESQNLTQAFVSFKTYLKQAFESFIPKKISKKNSNPPWYNYRLSKLKNKKNKAYKRYKKDKNNLFLRQSYLEIEKSFDVLNKFLYSNYVSTAESKVKKDSKSFWNFINTKRNSSGLPNCMEFSGSISSDLQTICNLFADYFESVYAVTSPSELPEFTPSNVVDIGIIQLEISDVLEALNRIDDNKGLGPDSISPKIIKKCATSLALPLWLIFNKSLKTGEFLNEWKTSYISPIFKSGAKQKICNYRPICKLSIIPKIFEKIVCDKLIFLTKQIVSDSQHGFVSGRSTATNLTILCDSVVSGFESGLQTDIIFTDFAKAFDRVNHEILLYKLSKLGIHSILLEWIRSYLTDRTQFVKIHRYVSKCIKVTSGVPQGSHIGPLFFNLFINDIPDIFQFSRFLLYADDVKIFRTIHSLVDCYLLQEDLCELASWCNKNLLFLNVAKCQSFTCSRKIAPIIFDYTINNITLDKVTEKKDLGVILDRKFTFSSHIDYIVNKAYKMLGFLKRNTREFSDSYALKSLYMAFVRSTLEYCCVVWNPYYANHSLRIERIQRSFTRYCFFKLNWNIIMPSYNVRCLLFGMETLEVRRKYFSIMMIKDIVSSHIMCPYLLEQINFYFPSRGLRIGFHLRETFSRSNYGRNVPIMRCIRETNAVIEMIDICVHISRDTFKKHVMLILLFH